MFKSYLIDLTSYSWVPWVKRSSFCSLWYAECAGANLEQLSRDLRKHALTAGAHDSSLKWTDTGASFPVLLMWWESQLPRGSGTCPLTSLHFSCPKPVPPHHQRSLSYTKEPFKHHKKLQKLLSNLLLVYSVLLKFHYGRETIPFVISLYNNMFWDGNLWMLKSFILNDISPCVC